MGRLWLALLPTFFVVAVSVCVIIHTCIHKNDYYILKVMAFLCVVAVMLVLDVPYFKDLGENQTTVIVAEYTGFQSNSWAGTRKVLFVDDNHHMELFVPTIARDVAKLQEGQTYEVVFFNNSKIVKSYTLAE